MPRWPQRQLTPEQVRIRIRNREIRLRPIPQARQHERFVSRRRAFNVRMEIFYVYMLQNIPTATLARNAKAYGWSKEPVTRANIHHHVKMALKWITEHAWFEDKTVSNPK